MGVTIWSMNRPVCIRHVIIVRYNNNNVYIENYIMRARASRQSLEEANVRYYEYERRAP